MSKFRNYTLIVLSISLMVQFSLAQVSFNIKDDLYSSDLSVKISDDIYSPDLKIKASDDVYSPDLKIELKKSGTVDYLVYTEKDFMTLNDMVIALLPAINYHLDYENDELREFFKQD